MKAVQKQERAYGQSPINKERTARPVCFFAASLGLFLALIFLPTGLHAQLQLLQAPGGLAGTEVGNNYFTSFGTMNALGIGTPTNGVTVIPLSNGALYYTEYQIQFSGIAAGHKASLTTYVSANFTHPAALVMENCPYTATCTSSGGYSAMSTSAAAPSGVIPSPGLGNTTVTAGIGIFLPDNDGGSAFTGNDSVEFTLTMKDLNTNTVLSTANLFLNSPAETVQDAVQLTLSTAAGGLTISPGADYSMNFGNVNGLGIGPGAGLSTSQVAGGVVYSTPYLLNAAYSDFTSSTGSLSVYVSSNFAHPTILQLRDSAASGGPFNNISLVQGTPTSITTSVHDRIPFTRYLGLFVSNVNGGTAFTGSDSAKLTFTLTVP